MTNQKKVNLNTSKVVAALIASGWYCFKINRHDDFCDIDISEVLLSPYSKIRVYDNVANYYEGSKWTFEGVFKSRKSILQDILHK